MSTKFIDGDGTKRIFEDVKSKHVLKAGDTMTGGLVVPSITLNGTSLAESKARIDQTWQPDENNPAGYIGMRIEGGGIIFFDYKYGYKYGSLSVAPKTNLKSYHVDKATNVVVCDNPGDTSKNDRFYVVQEFDIGERRHGECLRWGSGDCSRLFYGVETSTAFGQGYHNTELCIAAANGDGALEWAGILWHYLWEGDWRYRSPKWFLPSKDELNVLLNMQWQDSARWRGYNNEILKRIPVNFYSYYWSSSEALTAFESAFYAHLANFCNGNMYTEDKDCNTYNHVRLCRTF